MQASSSSQPAGSVGMVRKVGGFCRLVVRPLRHIGDFKGRSSGAEVAAFVFIAFVVYVLLAALALYIRPDWAKAVGASFQLAVLIPLIPLLVRRMHDQGLTGWWLLLFLPLLVLRAWQSYSTGDEFRLGVYDAFDHWPSDAFGFVQAAAAICWLGIFFFMLTGQPDKDGNRYGPDPRRFEPGDPDY